MKNSPSVFELCAQLALDHAMTHIHIHVHDDERKTRIGFREIDGKIIDLPLPEVSNEQVEADANELWEAAEADATRDFRATPTSCNGRFGLRDDNSALYELQSIPVRDGFKIVMSPA